MAAGDDFHTATAMGFEFAEQCVLFVGREAIAGRVGNDGDATGFGDPLHRFLQPRPAVRHIAGFAFGQVFAKHLGCVAAHARFDQVAGKVGA
jgi:hypothetical protein